MSPRLFPLAVLTLAVSLPSLQAARADDPPPAPQAAPPAPAPDAPPAEGERPRRRRENPFGGGPNDGGAREGGAREGGQGGQREGGPGGSGPGGGGRGGMRPDETPEQYKQRMLAPYVELVPDLDENQKTHIMAILEAVNLETRAIRENLTLSDERRRAATRFVRGSIPERITAALTDEQLVPYNKQRAEQVETMAEMDKVGSVRPEEDVEEMRARVLSGYEPVMEELSVKQKTAIIKILEASAEEAAIIKADTKRTNAQKTEALRQLHDGVSAKVLPLLDKEQAEAWKKVHAAKRP